MTSTTPPPGAVTTAAVPPDDDDGVPSRGQRSAPDEALDELDTSEWELDEKITAILRDEENQGARIEVYRKNAAGKWAWVENYDINDWSADKKKDIARIAGGGEYKCRVRRTGGRMGQTFYIVIDSAIKPASAADRDPSRDMAASVERLARGDGMMPLFMQMLQMQQAQSAQMMQQMQKSADTQVALMTAALTRQPTASGMDRIVEVLLMKAVAPAPAGPDLEKVIGALGKLRALSSTEADKEPADRHGFLDTIMEALPGVLNVLKSMQPTVPVETMPRVTAVTANPPRIPAAPVTPAAPAAPDIPVDDGMTAPAPGAKDDDMQRALSMFLPQLVEAAVAGQDALAVARTVYESEVMTDAMLDALCGVLERPDWFATLADAHEPVTLHVQFFRSLRDEFLRLDSEADDGGGSDSP